MSEDKAKYGEKEAELNLCPYCGKSDVKYTKSVNCKPDEVLPTQMNVDYGTCKNCKRTIYKISVNGISALGGWEEKEVTIVTGEEKAEIVKCPKCGSDEINYVATDDIEYFCAKCGERFGEDDAVKVKEGLKHCPFCGNEPTEIVRKGKNGWRDRYAVLCDYENGGCGAESGWYHYRAEAIDAWNRRQK